MKTLGSIPKTATIFLFVGILFFSCSVNDNDDYGTLVIQLPGSARAAVSQEFTNTLRYSVDCVGAGKESREFSPGESESIPLSPGNWDVAITVLNVANENIGQDKKSVVIEAGKTTTLPISIKIDTSRNEIKNFAITGSVQSVRESTIVHGSAGDYGKITVYISLPYDEPTGNERITINFTHTGKSANPPSGTTLSLDEAEALFEEYGITITAENGEVKSYTVEAVVEGLSSGGGGGGGYSWEQKEMIKATFLALYAEDPVEFADILEGIKVVYSIDLTGKPNPNTWDDSDWDKFFEALFLSDSGGNGGLGWPIDAILAEYGLTGKPASLNSTDIVYEILTVGVINSLVIEFTGSSANDGPINTWFTNNGWLSLGGDIDDDTTTILYQKAGIGTATYSRDYTACTIQVTKGF